MTEFFTPRLVVLPPAQQYLWPALGPAAEMGFVLYGGTAIALRLGHRESIDFDFFSEKPLNRDAIRSTFPFIATSLVLQDQQNTFTVNVPVGNTEQDHVKVSFFGMIGFGRVGQPEFTDDGVLQVASLDDLMATKVKVILQRAEAKDYRDIVAMVFFDDGDLHTLTKGERTCLIEAACAVSDLPGVEVLSPQLVARAPQAK